MRRGGGTDLGTSLRRSRPETRYGTGQRHHAAALFIQRSSPAAICVIRQLIGDAPQPANARKRPGSQVLAESGWNVLSWNPDTSRRGVSSTDPARLGRAATLTRRRARTHPYRVDAPWAGSVRGYGLPLRPASALLRHHTSCRIDGRLLGIEWPIRPWLDARRLSRQRRANPRARLELSAVTCWG